MVNGANVTLADVNTSNGVIHVIDKVLTPSDAPNDIARTAQCTGIHDSLVAAVVQAELLETLQGTGPFTLFAPTDQAFTDAGIDLAALDTVEGKAALTDILLYHVVSGEVPSSAVTECLTASTVNGNPISFTVGDSVMVNDATVTLADVNTSNGVIHVIDKVLSPTETPRDIPRTAQCTGIHDSLVASVIQAGLLPTLQSDGPFTVFAPTDQAFIDAGIVLADLDTAEGQATLSDILLYHVLNGEVPAANVTDCMSAPTVNGNPLSFTVGDSVMVNGATVVTADVATSNGVIHVIDKVLSPTSTPNDLPRTAQCTGIHNSLVAAVIQAELLETLQGDGPFTLFAPTDQAFADAGIDLATLDTPEGKAALTDILLYHVHTGLVQSSNITEGMMLQMVNGDNTTLSLTTGINGANITLADVMTSNGIIHVIDAVLMPPEDVVEDTSGDTVASEDDDISLTTIISLIAVGLVGALGAVLFLRSRGSDEETQKDLSELGIINNSQPITATSYATQQVQQPAATVDYSAQYAQQAQPAQQVATQAYVAQPVQAVQPIQTVEVIPNPVAAQPVVAEPSVVRQWTDEGGYTWRSMDDGNTYWWTGTEWKLYG